MNYIIFDPSEIRENLLPLTYTRPVAELRVGMLTLKEKWELALDTIISHQTEPYLANKYAPKTENDNIFINGSVIPTNALIDQVTNLEPAYAIKQADTIIAFRNDSFAEKWEKEEEIASPVTLIEYPWHIFKYNGDQIRADFNLITKDRESETIRDTNSIIYGKENVFLEPGVNIKAAIINAENGPVYLGKNSQIQEGAVIQGPFALGEEASINMGAKIRSDTTVGPYSKVGGEVINSVIQGFTNKAHDGFLGNSVIGEWCNLGADTNTSNLKNNYAEVKLWNYARAGFIKTGEQFCGLIMGDHSKCGINTMFNTGTVVGVGANIFGAGYPRNFIPSFSWGGHGGFSTFKIKKMIELAKIVMARRNLTLTEADETILQTIFQLTHSYRNWEK